MEVMNTVVVSAQTQVVFTCAQPKSSSALAVIKCYGNFQCADNQCVSLAKVCNGVSDCVDGSDERNCGTIEMQIH